jgi:hypothetical protein
MAGTREEFVAGRGRSRENKQRARQGARAKQLPWMQGRSPRVGRSRSAGSYARCEEGKERLSAEKSGRESGGDKRGWAAGFFPWCSRRR